MQYEFDNTIEALLRRTASRREGELLSENVEHLDADALSLFAENILPPATRQRFAAHLSDCSDCRQILTQFVLAQESEQEEPVSTTETIAPRPTWRERFAQFFTLPNLGYAAAGLLVLFIGAFALIALRSNQENRTAEIARVEVEQNEKAKKEKRASAPAAAQQNEAPPEPAPEVQPNSFVEVPDNSNINSAENSNQTAQSDRPAEVLPPSYRITTGQSNGATAKRETEVTAREQNRNSAISNSAAGANVVASAPPSAAISTPTDNRTTTALAAPKTSAQPPLVTRENNAGEEKDAQTSAALSEMSVAKRAETAAAVKPAVVIRTIGNKTFQKVGDVWQDNNFSNQNAKIISRGSDDYKKLDAGLRSIADTLGGAVNIVWQGKAYKIR